MKGGFKLWICFLLLFTCNSFAADAQNTNTGYPPVRSVSPEKIHKYLSDRDFNYERNYTPTTSLWGRIVLWIERHLFTPIFKGSGLTLWDIILYAVAIAAIGLIIYYFLKSDKVGLIGRKTKTVSPGINVIEEDIHQLNFDKLISDAVASNQYRVAIRYLYLKSLRDLSVKGLILWKPDKTNRDYMNEMRASVFGRLFRDITYLFDYAWYGHNEINEMSFANIKDTFDQFNKELYTA